MRKKKVFITLFATICLTLIIHSYQKQAKETTEFPEILFGIPTFQDSRLSNPMSSFTGDPYIAVFLTNAPHEEVIKFYEDKLNMTHKKIEYGGRVASMTIYQFQLEEGLLTNHIYKGVEIIPFNHFNRRAFKARTKIKIYIPQREVQEQQQKNQQKQSETNTEE